ncbi:HmuY family protein [Flavobacterium sp. MMLR14_040]|uniref:HmuY family protein n=1 Tax=Flavobacterium sp. MMLR14_040 TaxID=3093843 RepID=UPI00299016D9|nr:HmuY family protein [Flavobacterium sp. MMLR14_040]MDW8849177.1 HmuY family protein [Flavobacterium sp. MMLR14_040]
MKKNFILILSFVIVAIGACSSDDEVAEANAVAFASTSLNLSAESTPIEIKFASPTASAGSLTLTVTETAVATGTDFSTTPAVTANTVVVPFEKNVSTVSFTFKKLKEAIEGEVKNVVFTISSATINTVISENKSIQVNFNETASLGNALAPEVGGPTEPNQVFVDLSSGKMTAVPRVSWDLGFYSGTDFRVIINHTVRMTAKETTSVNIDEVQAEDETMLVNGSGSTTQIDDPAGDITKTAIAVISATDADNKVYVINMGSNPGTVDPKVGSEGTGTGPSRGWKKVRILRSGNDYKVQYADLAATTHEEIIVSKNVAYNFTFLSLLDKKTVSVEPQKTQWDISFTSFTNTTPTPTGGLAPYNFADFVLNNLKGGAKAYQVLTTAFTYDAFTLANVDNAKFTDDQRNIGSNWRGTVSGTDANGNPTSGFAARSDRFFVVKDPAGNVYKVRFTAGVNAAGERGYPTFQYAILK